ncbi:hypothetical protein CBS101457_000678 [Exobasidium rhododendri]|nr:hypothetical protein CBS101457_000678 [Exobasidium rhododendri]
MFSVHRFDGSSSASNRDTGSPNNGKLDRIALINQRKAAQQQHVPLNSQEAHASTSQIVPSAQPATPLIPSALSSSSPSTVAAAKPASTIHPSRLAISHVLRQADKKAKSSLNGVAKERTKAKQRYLKTKKDRRKKRKASEANKGQKGGFVQSENAMAFTTSHVDDAEDVDDTEEDESDSDEQIQDQHIEIVHSPQRIDSFEDASSSSSSASTSGQDPSGEEEEGGNDGAAEDVAMRALEDKSTAEGSGAQTEEGNLGLSRFPAPRRTLQASRRDLAAQGLPSGLANPQRIDPTLTKSVRKDDHTDLDQISPAMKERLVKLGITQWFAVQTAVIPTLLSHPLSRSLYPNPPLPDLCVSAPTGSGKTLSFAVPIVEVLSERLIRRLRALIILPTRDLVNQVKETMMQVSKGTPLSIAAITGQQSISQEQDMLMGEESTQKKRSVPGLFVNEAKAEEATRESHKQSKVDILIATPGRLIDHLELTPGFTLQHLRFLVIDEADRLLGQSFQEWLPRVLEGLDPGQEPTMESASSLEHSRDASGDSAPARLMESRLRADDSLVLMQDKEECGVQKLLFSATLTRDPAKILALKLRNAAFVSVEEEEEEVGEKADNEDGAQWEGRQTNFIDRQVNFTLPASLREHMMVMKGEEKPLHLLHLLFTHEPRLRQALCFTKSIENAARLVKLINFFQQVEGSSLPREDRIVVKEYSSDLTIHQRRQLLSSFKENKIDLLVCSDVIARGIDLPDVQHVISYDVPIDMAKYVHRVGRTARANRQGDAWTLVEEQEARHFKRMIRRGGRKGKIVKAKAKQDDLEALQKDYSEALTRLEGEYVRKIE